MVDVCQKRPLGESDVDRGRRWKVEVYVYVLFR